MRGGLKMLSNWNKRDNVHSSTFHKALVQLAVTNAGLTSLHGLPVARSTPQTSRSSRVKTFQHDA